MTQDEKDRLQYMIDVMQAYKDGKEIEVRLAESETWTLVDWKPLWDWVKFDYRVKPEPPKPQYRPFESAEEVMEAIKEHGLIIKPPFFTDGVRALIVEFNDTHIWYGTSSIPREYSYCFDRDYIFADGTPFGKLIEE